MRRPVFGLYIFPILILLTAAGCSNVNVEATSDSEPPHEKIFREEMEGRSPDYRRPAVIELPDPDYPAETAGLDLAGLVMIKMLIGPDGKVVEAEVVQGLHPAVDQAALAAARGGSYTPASELGVATEGWLTVPFRFPPEEKAD